MDTTDTSTTIEADSKIRFRDKHPGWALFLGWTWSILIWITAYLGSALFVGVLAIGVGLCLTGWAAWIYLGFVWLRIFDNPFYWVAELVFLVLVPVGFKGIWGFTHFPGSPPILKDLS